MYTCIHTYMHACIIHSFIHSFVRSFIHSFIHACLDGWMDGCIERERERTCNRHVKFLRMFCFAFDNTLGARYFKDVSHQLHVNVFSYECLGCSFLNHVQRIYTYPNLSKFIQSHYLSTFGWYTGGHLSLKWWHVLSWLMMLSFCATCFWLFLHALRDMVVR